MAQPAPHTRFLTVPCVEHVIAEHGVSERFACRVLGQHRSTQRKVPTSPMTKRH